VRRTIGEEGASGGGTGDRPCEIEIDATEEFGVVRERGLGERKVGVGGEKAINLLVQRLERVGCRGAWHWRGDRV
jgi:hypothetical protein